MSAGRFAFFGPVYGCFDMLTERCRNSPAELSAFRQVRGKSNVILLFKTAGFEGEFDTQSDLNDAKFLT